MKWIGPWSGFMSFNPLKAQIEMAFSNAPVWSPEPENGTSGVPRGPCTSPARAAPAPAPATATAHTAAAKKDFVRMFSPLLKSTPVLASAPGNYYGVADASVEESQHRHLPQGAVQANLEVRTGVTHP